MTPDTTAPPVGNGSVGTPAATDPDVASAKMPAATATPTETRTQRFRRKAHRSRLHGYAITGVALVAYLVTLAASNTTHVKISWAFGSSHVSLVWLVLSAAVLGWLLVLRTAHGCIVAPVHRAQAGPDHDPGRESHASSHRTASGARLSLRDRSLP